MASAGKTWLSAIVLGLLGANTDPFSNQLLEKVKGNLLNVSEKSWEKGTATQALLEFDWPSVSVFSPTAFHIPSRLNATFNVANVREIAREVIQNKPAGEAALVSDGAAGDPPSLGVAVLFANWTREDKSDQRYSQASQSQLEHLLHTVPRLPNGAISHRESEAQAWSDFAYMAPPFIGYYGAIHEDRWLLREAYNQLKYYREVLRTPSAGLWKHVVQGSWQDNNHWATGNGWAAGGMLRVHQTIAHSPLSSEFESERRDLLAWTDEILENTWKNQAANGTLVNYIDQPQTFGDTASTALLAAMTYRHAVITGDDTHIPYAKKAYDLVKKSVTKDGWLLNTVDPMTFDSPLKPGQHSAEGQAFVLMLHAAWVAYYEKKYQEVGGKDSITGIVLGSLGSA